MQTDTLTPSPDLAAEVARRRTFAIISHPDAGKTTLTEKLLLYAGAVEQAGGVRTRKQQRHATSDWMAMERERGISITSTVLQFTYQDCHFNLLDTPGHQDFSEDTYRTLTAVDSAIMVLDRANGIEPQTLKLFEVCRQRNIPILTFINKMDRPGRDPLELLDEIERVLGMTAVPMNWPIHSDGTFQGVYDLQQQQVLLFERTVGGQFKAPVQVRDSADPQLLDLLGADAVAQLHDDVALLDAAGAPFDRAAFLAGATTPVFFGSAVNNFGVAPFLDALITYAPPPQARMTSQGLVAPTDPMFLGFVFKIQANMDPQHRDRMAFLRVCAGHFHKDMQAVHGRLGRKIRMARPHRLFARERETIEDAYPGDVIGLSNPGLFQIGDTVCSVDGRQLTAIPRFPPEHFAQLENLHIEKQKQFTKGLSQLEEEGVIQLLFALDGRRTPILAAVGELQFDVVQARLEGEYGVASRREPFAYTTARWVTGSPAALSALWTSTRWLHVHDRNQQDVVLFRSPWDLQYCVQHHPQVTFRAEAGE
ncbi:MAG TPA: peptide chain release factor 3 [Herpetosiphonaceae bacterium]